MMSSAVSGIVRALGKPKEVSPLYGGSILNLNGCSKK